MLDRVELERFERPEVFGRLSCVRFRDTALPRVGVFGPNGSYVAHTSLSNVLVAETLRVAFPRLLSNNSNACRVFEPDIRHRSLLRIPFRRSNSSAFLRVRTAFQNAPRRLCIDTIDLASGRVRCYEAASHVIHERMRMIFFVEVSRTRDM